MSNKTSLIKLLECLYCRADAKYVDMRTGYYICENHRWAVPPNKRREVSRAVPRVLNIDVIKKED